MPTPTELPTIERANHQAAVSPAPSLASDQPARGKSGGAPRDNANATTHGLKASKLPPGSKHEEMALYRFRRFVRNTLAAMHGDVGIYLEALLQSATRHETRALLAARWLRKEGDGLPLSDRLNLLATISNATDARDRCLKAMGLVSVAIPGGNDDEDPWATVDALRKAEALEKPAAASNGSTSRRSTNGDSAAPWPAEKPTHANTEGGDDAD